MLDVQVAQNTTSASPGSRTQRRPSPTAGSRRRSRCWAGMATWTLPGPRGHVQGMFNLLVSSCCNFCLFARVSWPICSQSKKPQYHPLLHVNSELIITLTLVRCRAGSSSMHMMNEDCLYLNIFTKNLIKRNNYDPVSGRAG